MSGLSAEASGVLTVDLAALRDNYRKLKSIASGARSAAVIKADAYGTGAPHAVRALTAEDCGTFFVATLGEARIVRATAPDVTIYVLDGLFPDAGPAFADIGARPVLGSIPEIRDWAAFCKTHGQALPAAIHIDTGMNRLGLPPGDVDAAASDTEALGAFE
ncbi:MAG: alanine racemase, partial [Methyloligellaceae bacterium]